MLSPRRGLINTESDCLKKSCDAWQRDCARNLLGCYYISKNSKLCFARCDLRFVRKMFSFHRNSHFIYTCFEKKSVKDLVIYSSGSNCSHTMASSTRNEKILAVSCRGPSDLSIVQVRRACNPKCKLQGSEKR